MKNGMFDVPKGSMCVENPDGVFDTQMRHSLYDKPIVDPVIPGDWDNTNPLRQTNDAGRLHGDVD